MTAHIQPPLVEVGPIPTIDTARLFRPAKEDLSPIDKFIANTNAINKILAGAVSGGSPSPELCSVVVQGYLSAVETYFRTLLSRLVHIDPLSQKAMEKKQLSFSVAMSRPRDTLAEALTGTARLRQSTRLQWLARDHNPPPEHCAQSAFGSVAALTFVQVDGR